MTQTRAMTRTAEATTWTCGSCGVRATRMPGFQIQRPSGWRMEEGEVTCLLCRRAEAGEQGVEAAEPTTGEKTVRIRTASVIEFELDRDPDRSNSVIAKVCHTSVPTVLRVRGDLGLAAAPAPQTKRKV